MSKHSLAALLFLFLAILPARADQPGWADMILHAPPGQTIDMLKPDEKAFLTSAKYHADVQAALAKEEKKVTGCNDFAVEERDKFFIVGPDGKFVRPLTTQAPGYIPAWFERWTVAACGKPGYRSLIVTRGKDMKMQVEAAVPGATHADPVLQLDTFRIGHVDLAPGCDDKAVINTAIIDDSKLAQHDWTEAWTLRLCRNTVTRMVHYSPGAKGNEQGTTITVTNAPAWLPSQGASPRR